MTRLWLFLLTLSFGTVAAHAQTVRWDPPGGTLAVGQTTQLQLVFENCEPSSTPTLPKVDGLTMEAVGRSEYSNTVNFTTTTKTVIIAYAALLTKKQSVEIPAFSTDTTQGRQRVSAAKFEPGTATVGRTGRTVDSVVSSQLTVAPASVWAGEVFNLNYQIDVARSYSPDFGRGNIDWTPDPLVTEDWSRPEAVELRAANEARTGLVYRTRGFARSAGSYRLNPLNQIINLAVGSVGLGFFQQRQYEQFNITSTQPIVEVRALPSSPAGFAGAVGDFKITSKVVPATVTIGEPVTWTLELTGSGNWPDIQGLPSREVSKDFQVIQPQAKRTPNEGKLFDVTLTEDVVLMPTRPGTYTLAPVSFVYFDPKAGAYKTLTTPRTTVTVTGATPSATPTITAPGEEKSSATGTASTPTINLPPPTVPTLPTALPRDPLPAGDTAAVPLAKQTLLIFLPLPFLVPLAVWVWLALRRARETDPLRAQREARARLAQLIASLPGQSPSAEQRPAFYRQLLQWQHDTATLFGLAHAAPSAAALSDTTWAQLWSEVDRALYSAQPELPADWRTRAETALASKSLPRFSALRLFLPRNLLPFAALLAVSFLSVATLRAADGSAAYRATNYADAEKAWRDSIAKNPTDWSARHNLSLALAQQDHWGDAAAQASTALVQNPSSDAVRAQFQLTTQKAGFVPAPLAEFSAQNTAFNLAGFASPTEWQYGLLAASALAAAALTLLLLSGYGVLRFRAAPWIAGVLLIASVLGAACSAVGFHAYGEAANPRAIVVAHATQLRSIPTEADTTQKTVPLSAGSVGLVGRTLLGRWVQLTFANGQTGWVRVEEVVYLWR